MSTLTISNLSDGTKTIATTNLTNSAPKAHVTFDQQNGNITKNSFNISSQTDDATGRTTSTFSSAFNSANDICFIGQVFDGGGANDARTLNQDVGTDTYTASAIKYYCLTDSNATLNDATPYFVAFIGDLA